MFDIYTETDIKRWEPYAEHRLQELKGKIASAALKLRQSSECLTSLLISAEILKAVGKASFAELLLRAENSITATIYTLQREIKEYLDELETLQLVLSLSSTHSMR